jgi:hypothetical protein
MTIMTITEARNIITDKIALANEKLGVALCVYGMDHGGAVPSREEIQEMNSIVAKFMSDAANSSENIKAVLLPMARDLFLETFAPTQLKKLNEIYRYREEIDGLYETLHAIDECRLYVGGERPEGGFSPVGFHPEERVWAVK